ncbi:MAG: glycosyltransferase family 4 protein [Ruthenibacterium sp.]
MQKRILVVSQHYWPENFRITDICKGFADDGIAVDVLCGIPNYPQGEWFSGYSYTKPRRETHENCIIFRAGEIRRKGNTSLSIFLNYISFPVCACFNLWRLHGRHYDAVFCYETSPVLMMLPAIVYAKPHRVPLTTYVLDLWPENLYSVLPIQNKFLRRIASAVSHWHYRRSEQLIAMSPALAEKIKSIAPNAKIAMIPQYCEDFYAQKCQKVSPLTPLKGAFTVLFAGNFSPAQDLNLLIACAKRLKEAARNDIHFVLVGDGMSRAALVADIRKNDLSSYFTLKDSCPASQIPAYHAAADALFAALAKSEDLGLTVPAKIAGYLAAEKPLLAAISGEASHIINDAHCGFASESGDADALFANLVALADLPAAARAQMGANGFAYYEAHYRRSILLSELEHFILNESSI